MSDSIQPPPPRLDNLGLLANAVWTLGEDNQPRTACVSPDRAQGGLPTAEGVVAVVNYYVAIRGADLLNLPVCWLTAEGWWMGLISESSAERLNRELHPDRPTLEELVGMLPLPSWGLFPELGALLRDSPRALARWYAGRGLPEACAAVLALIDGEENL